MSVSRVVELNESQKEKIKSAALAAFPKEMCGVLTADDFIQIANIHSNPGISFTMAPGEYVKVVGRAVAIVHSHTKDMDIDLGIDPRTPSFKDITNQKLSGLPWLIVATEGKSVTPPIQLPRTPDAKYENRNFIWYINDCFNIVQDYYRFQLEIILPDNIFNPFEDDLKDVIVDYADKHGFKDIYDVDNIKNGDIVILDSLGKKRNHLGVYHDEMILHQMQTSKFEPFVNHKDRISRILRYGN